MDIPTGIGLTLLFVGIPVAYIWAIDEAERRGRIDLSLRLEEIGLVLLVVVIVFTACTVQLEPEWGY